MIDSACAYALAAAAMWDAQVIGSTPLALLYT